MYLRDTNGVTVGAGGGGGRRDDPPLPRIRERRRAPAASLAPGVVGVGSDRAEQRRDAAVRRRLVHARARREEDAHDVEVAAAARDVQRRAAGGRRLVHVDAERRVGEQQARDGGAAVLRGHVERRDPARVVHVRARAAPQEEGDRARHAAAAAVAQRVVLVRLAHGQVDAQQEEAEARRELPPEHVRVERHLVHLVVLDLEQRVALLLRDLPGRLHGVLAHEKALDHPHREQRYPHQADLEAHVPVPHLRPRIAQQHRAEGLILLITRHLRDLPENLRNRQTSF